MQSQNISDIIEKYLKSILADSEHVEIRRSEIADLFNVVPSQINYVIKTRFTIQNGYLVESKRAVVVIFALRRLIWSMMLMCWTPSYR